MEKIFDDINNDLDEALFRMNQIKGNFIKIRESLIKQALEQGWTREEIEARLNKIESV